MAWGYLLGTIRITSLTVIFKCRYNYPNMRPTEGKRRAIEAFQVAERPLHTSEILKAGVHPRDLYALRDAGVLERVSRGVYRLTDLPPLTEPDLVTISSRVPKAVICLISSLRFHGLTEEIPRVVNIALLRGAPRPRLDWPPVEVSWFSGEMFNAGIATHEIDKVSVRIYNPAKTVADCFKFRNRIGTEVAIGALRQGLAERRFTPAEFMRFARICRVGRVVRPYLEALL